MQDSTSLLDRFSGLVRDRHSSTSQQVYKLNIPDRYSSAEDFGKTSSTASDMSSFSSLSSLSASFRSLRIPRRRGGHTSQQQKRCSVGTTGTSVVTVCNDDEDDDGNRIHEHDDDEEDDIAILQPEEDERASSSPESRGRRWRRSFSSMRMALSRSSSLSSKSKSYKKAPTTMYSISFYPWKRDPRAYYSHPEAAAQWVPDTASKRCQICLAAFHLTRRRHHCRICGLLACNDCSLQRTYFPFTKERRSQHHLIKDGAAQRTCNACAGTLKNMAAQSDPRVKKFTVHPPVADPFGMRDDSDDFDSHGYRSSSQWRVSIGDEDIYVIDSDKVSRLQLALVSSGASQAQADELDEVLRARVLSRKNPKPKYYVVSTKWLEQWLQYVHIDAPSSSSAGHPTKSSGSRTTTKAYRNVRPGPIANYALLNFVSGKLVPKDDLERSRGNDAGGDYRIVSEEVWSVFLRLYGGGPCIQLRMEDNDQHSPPKSVHLQQTLVRAHSHSALNNGGCADGATDSSRWIILEIDDTIQKPLISKEPADLFKGNSKVLRRAASTSSLGHNSGSSNLRKGSSVYPIRERETAPCITDAVVRGQQYYPRDSLVNCITSPALTNAEERRASTTPHRHQQPKHPQPQQQQQISRDSSASALSNSFIRTSSSSVSNSNEFSKVSVGTVLYDSADSVTTRRAIKKSFSRGRSSRSSSKADLPTEHSSRDAAARVKGDESPRAPMAAVSAFAVVATEARKQSAMSLKSSRASAATTAAPTSA